jgi:hypothetical protein
VLYVDICSASVLCDLPGSAGTGMELSRGTGSGRDQFSFIRNLSSPALAGSGSGGSLGPEVEAVGGVDGEGRGIDGRLLAS